MNLLLPVALLLMLGFAIMRLRVVGVFGWIIFALFWFSKAPGYIQIGDYYNTGIVLLAGIFFILLSYTISVVDPDKLKLMSQVTFFSTLAGLIYFPFAIIETLRDSLISLVINLILTTGHYLGYNLTLYSWNIIESNGRYVEIIPACTAIESIALFTGASFGVSAPFNRKIKAFVISVFPIFFLNILRNVFVILAYSYSWFGDNSFYIAHHVISKIGATVALIAIAYAVFEILPELENLLVGLKNTFIEVMRGKK